MKLTETAQLAEQCFSCGQHAQPGALCLAHRNRNAWGLESGRGAKNADCCGAIVCGPCHAWLDGDGQNDSDAWELAHLRTLCWWLKMGYIKEACKGIRLSAQRHSA